MDRNLLTIVIITILSVILWMPIPFYIDFALKILLLFITIGFSIYYFKVRTISKHLISQRAYQLILLFYIFSLILDLFAYIIQSSLSIKIYEVRGIIIGTFPLLLINYIETFTRVKSRLFLYFSSLMIFMSPILLEIQNVYVYKYMDYYIYQFPTLFNLLLVLISYIIIGLGLFIAIKDSNRIFMYGFTIYFLANIVTNIIIYIHPNDYQIYDIQLYIGLFLILLPTIIDKHLSIHLIPQYIDVLIVMRSNGLPIFEYNFTSRNDMDAILFSGAISAITAFIQDSIKFQSSLVSIEFMDSILLIKRFGNFFAILKIHNEYSILHSVLELFIKEFSKIFSKKYKSLESNNIQVNSDLDMKLLVDELF